MRRTSSAILILAVWLIGTGPLWAESPVHKTISLSYGPKKTSLPVMVQYPRNYNKSRRYPVIFALPPGPGTMQMVKGSMHFWEKEAYRRGYFVVCPQILGRRLQREAPQVLKSVFGWIDKNLSYDPKRVTIAGASNGGVGTFFAVMQDPKRFNAVIAFPGAYAGKLEALSKLKGKPVWLIVGEKDPMWKAGAEATLKALKKAGARASLEILPGQGHMLRINPKRMIDWIEKNRARH